MRVEVELDQGRGPVLVKRAKDDDGIERLSIEASALRAARHPGVVQMLSHEAGPDGTALRLRWVGPHSLATAASLDPGSATELVAAVAETVADLHDRGIAHGRLTPDHIVLGSDGVPIICGLRCAGSTREKLTADDVAELGGLLRHLLGPNDGTSDIDPIPDRRRPWGGPPWDGYRRRGLLTLIDHATDDVGANRPSARAFATALREMTGHRTVLTRWGNRRSSDQRASHPLGRAGADHPGADHAETTSGGADGIATPNRLAGLRERLGRSHAESIVAGTDAPSGPRPPHGGLGTRERAADTGPERRALAVRRRLAAGQLDQAGRRPAVLAVALAALVLLAMLGGRQLQGARQRTTSGRVVHLASESPGRSPEIAPTPDAPTSLPASTAGLASTSTSTAPDAPSTTNDCCRAAVPGRAPQVDFDGVSYAIGRPGDLVLLGEWHCSTKVTPAVLRKSTGEIFLFDSWAEAGQALTVRARAVVTHASGLRKSPAGPDGCTQLVVVRAGADPVVIPTGPGR